jgi:Flp pilus assembly protein TadD
MGRSHQERFPAGRAKLILAPVTVTLALLAASCGGSSNPSASSDANALISQGRHAESIGDSAQAARDFRSAAASDRSNALAYYDLGALDQYLHDPTQAVTAYKQALSRQPKDRNAMFNLAVIDTPSEPQAAENLYNELRLLYPKDAQVDFNLGLLLIAQNQPVPGHTILKKAISLDPALAKQVPAGITP